MSNIGGIKNTNALRALHGAVAPSVYRCLDGLAVISEIVASAEPLKAAKRLAQLIGTFKALDSPPVFSFVSTPSLDAHYFVREAAGLLSATRVLTPLVHQVRRIFISHPRAQQQPDHQHSRHYTVCKCDSCARRVSYHGQRLGGDARSKSSYRFSVGEHRYNRQ
jgi:hypothetical protein